MYILIIGALVLFTGLYFFARYGFFNGQEQTKKMLWGMITMIAGGFLISFGAIVTIVGMAKSSFCS